MHPDVPTPRMSSVISALICVTLLLERHRTGMLESLNPDENWGARRSVLTRRLPRPTGTMGITTIFE